MGIPSEPDASASSNDPGAALRAEIAALSSQLSALPLNNSNRDVRLKLNEAKRQKETELDQLLRSLRGTQLQRQLQQLSAQLLTLGHEPEHQAKRVELSRAVKTLKVELQMLERST